jgi:dephospho-CoA kinase
MSPNSETAFGRIGIAGYMGSGKSTCAGFIAGLAGPEARVSIIDADGEAKRMMNRDESIRRRLATSFGATVIHDSAVGFGELGKAAFASVETIRRLNGIVHPPLVKHLQELVTGQRVPCILDAALIPLWGIEDWFDRCLWVTASPQRRLERTRAKSGLSAEQIRARMSVQEALFGAPGGGSWIIVENEGSLDELRGRIAGLHIFPRDIQTQPAAP